MIASDPMAERHGRVLHELSELGLELARKLQARALAAEDDAVAADLALSFHRISRSVRQTLALEARLERERHRQVIDDQALAVRQAETLRRERKARVRLAVERLVWSELEPDEAESLLDGLDDLLEEAALAPTFLEGSVEAHIQRIRQDLGLTADPPAIPDRSSG
jgi:hypothetical protein